MSEHITSHWTGPERRDTRHVPRFPNDAAGEYIHTDDASPCDHEAGNEQAAMDERIDANYAQDKGDLASYAVWLGTRRDLDRVEALWLIATIALDLLAFPTPNDFHSGRHPSSHQREGT